MARTDTLGHFLTDVADAIRTKTGTSETIQASTFDTAISNIPGGSSKYAPSYVSFYNYKGNSLSDEIEGLDTSNLTTMESMFYGCNNLTSLDLSSWNFSNITSLKYMFGSCANLTTITFPNDIDTSNVNNMNGLFNGCSKLTTCDFSKLDTSNVTTMESMFFGLRMDNFDISMFDTSKVTTMAYMFKTFNQYRTNTNDFDMSGWDTNSLTNISSMFTQANFRSINFGNLDLSKITGNQGYYAKCLDYCECKDISFGNNFKLYDTSKYFFQGYTAYNDTTLNRILQVCINSTDVSAGNKTLSYFNLTPTQARVEACANYQAFLDAGWTIS